MRICCTVEKTLLHLGHSIFLLLSSSEKRTCDLFKEPDPSLFFSPGGGLQYVDGTLKIGGNGIAENLEMRQARGKTDPVPRPADP
jgi:hypothetical protein